MRRWRPSFHSLLVFHLLPLFLSACLRIMSRSEPLTLTHLAISSATTSLRNSWVMGGLRIFRHTPLEDVSVQGGGSSCLELLYLILLFISRSINRLTGTDGFRLLCHQFILSSFPRLGNCLSRCNACWLTMKPLTQVLLRWVANGGRGQNAGHRAFPLPPGRWSFIAWWRTTNHFVWLHRTMGSRLKRCGRLSCFPCLLPLDRLHVQGQNAASSSCPCTCRRHRTSLADAGATSPASPCSGDGNRAGKEREPGGSRTDLAGCQDSLCTCRRARKSSSPVA
jgi:hypothetical protein